MVKTVRHNCLLMSYVCWFLVVFKREHTKSHSCCRCRQHPVAYGEDIIMDREDDANLMTLHTLLFFKHECYCVTCREIGLCPTKCVLRLNIEID